MNHNYGDFKAIYRARRAFKAWKNDFKEDRKRIQKSRAKSSVPERKKYSLLWQYYVKGVRKYSDLSPR